ncbi:hypothetical protein TWF569_005449 [Orbilia oligospora]|uniref:Uncharacterized protein n=1 Tax=Orbilia oligospora TaxID=2813651 RepID=A0A7C8JAR3_ORBOL|nr:hypothetical protein TWF102_008996 [Orbilia oligospora]KAF3101774.1 hypothetical protein TWF706_005526 [Orbilia oligospora]KAF3110823.1 hypothetical protein TWF103_004152 [Orbilia oligospora]KAF3131830.1 hypothetical protein TWF703_007549 [Orbilia oligospora]KAF3135893.1 hypothetical protein TWF594_008095 [Orbilia oligospora]
MSTPANSAQLSAASAFWGLIGLALNIIIQPTVCVADSICTVIRLLFNIFYYKLSFKKACRLTLHRKKFGCKGEPHQEQGHSNSRPPVRTEEPGDETHSGEVDIEIGELQNEQGHSDSGSPTQVEVEGFGDSTNPAEVGPEATVEALGPGNVTGNMQQESSRGSLTSEGPSAARVLSFTFGGFLQWLKIIVCSGTPWTSTWASFYFWPFMITEVINITAGGIETEEDRLDQIRIDRINSKWEVRLDFYERALGVFAIFMQLIVFLVLEIHPPRGIINPMWAQISLFAHIPTRVLIYFLAYLMCSVSNPFVLGMAMGGWRANASRTADIAISLGNKAFWIESQHGTNPGRHSRMG